MSARETALDRWRTVCLSADKDGTATTSKQIARLQRTLGKIAGRMVHGTLGTEEEALLAQFKDDLMLLIELRAVQFAQEVLESRERQSAAYSAAADRGRLQLESSRPA
jgi:hypothetical protein